jgi:hypothetical protein
MESLQFPHNFFIESLQSHAKAYAHRKESNHEKILLTLLVVIVTLGLLGAASYTGYRYGVAQGIRLL